MMSYTHHKGSLKPGHKAYNSKPGKGIRRGIRRRKERERYAAELRRLEEQSEKNWKRLVPERQTTTARTRGEPRSQKNDRPIRSLEEKVPPTDAVGQKLHLTLRLGTILRSDPVGISQQFAIQQSMRDLDIVIPPDYHFSTFGPLYDWLRQEHQANQDPNWQSLKWEIKRHGPGNVRLKDTSLWFQMRFYVCTWAMREHGVNLWNSDFGSQPMTYAEGIEEVLYAKARMQQVEADLSDN